MAHGFRKNLDKTLKGSYSPQIGSYKGLAMLSTSIRDALFTKTQQRVLGLLYGRPDVSFYTNEIVRIADMGRGTVSRELARLAAAGLLVVRKEGNQQHYQANPACPVYEELSGLVRKTFGMADVIRSALEPLARHIHWSFIFGSIADGRETADSDIDLMVIGDVKFAKVVNALYPVQEKLGREINPKIYSREEWTRMLKSKDAFVKEVLVKPRLDLLGEPI
jgi:predicted nucleotidyltransferase